MQNEKFALLAFSLLAFSLLLFGCLNQGTQGETGSSAVVGLGQVVIDPQDTAGVNDAAAAGQDLNNLEFNESQIST